MLIRLTTPEALDRLIVYLEKERGLTWPQLDTKEPFRDWWLRTAKEEMKNDTILLEVNWEYNSEKARIDCFVSTRPFREIVTDEEYLKENQE